MDYRHGLSQTELSCNKPTFNVPEDGGRKDLVALEVMVVILYSCRSTPHVVPIKLTSTISRVDKPHK
jgi:hypothetical protein